jgi:hypothetical protein
LFIAFSPVCRHWFVLPVTVCGVLLTNKAVDAVLEQGAIFTADGLVGIIGFHFFFLCPLLVVSLEHRLLYLPGQPDDWRDWMGRMAAINIAGLLAYQFARGKALELKRPWKTAWLLDESRFNVVTISALFICGAVEIYLLVDSGGITGFVDRYLHDKEAWVNMGWLFVIGESTPILAMMAFGQWAYQRRRTMGWPIIALVLVGFLIAQIVCGGLRGSRSNTITCLFWAVGIVNYCVRSVPKGLMALGFVVVMSLMYVGGFYKDLGTDAANDLASDEERSLMSQRTGRTLEVVALGDLGRSDIQAFVLYRLSDGHADYQLAWGQTYLGALALLIPRVVWPTRPEGKSKWTTEVEYGEGTYNGSSFRSSRVYGLMGEWMLNFGWYLGPLSMAALGLLVGVTQRFTRTAARGDCRKMLIPIIAVICVTILASDSDNNVYSLVKYLMIPSAVLWMSTRKATLRRQPSPVTGAIADGCLSGMRHAAQHISA